MKHSLVLDFCKSKKLLGTVAGKPAAGELSGGETIIEEGELAREALV